MRSDSTSPAQVKPHPSNKNWTQPKTWGVWELPRGANGRKYRYGNYPIRGIELKNESSKVSLVALYLSRESAKDHAKELNIN